MTCPRSTPEQQQPIQNGQQHVSQQLHKSVLQRPVIPVFSLTRPPSICMGLRPVLAGAAGSWMSIGSTSTTEGSTMAGSATATASSSSSG
mmetsp:Transcript_10688/g.30545  ORF Transcript_10688/g.30545 Transcript_10688/m.30545 type:complete len:90 (-) Transcript_10688:161-430(-)